MTRSFYKYIFIVLIAVFFVFLFWKSERKEIIPQYSDDVVLFKKGLDGDSYQIDLITSVLKPYKNDFEKIESFSGFPADKKTDKTDSFASRIFYSKDKSQAIVTLLVVDSTASPSEFDGSQPIIEKKEYLCILSVKQCQPSDLLFSAEEAEKDIFWFHWDSSKGLFYGHSAGEGVGNSSPVVIFDANKKTSQKTSGYGLEYYGEKRAEVPSGAFSPSLQKFIMIDEGRGENWKPEGGNNWKLLLYYTNKEHSDNLSRPFHSFDISSLEKDKYDGVPSVNWSADEKLLAIGTDNRIYTLNLETGQISLKFEDKTKAKGGLYWDFNNLQFSPSNRFIVFVDYVYSADDINSQVQILKAIDLKNSDKIYDIISDQDLIELIKKQ
ncbi:MAG: hypothetical protein AAB621_02030 [Patescibacteria group bacterium]